MQSWTRSYAEFGIIPLNSPRYYLRNNGAIENGQRKLKAWLRLAGG